MGRYWHKWRRLSFQKQLRFVRAVFSLLLIKGGLILLPFSIFRKIFNWFSNSNGYSNISTNCTASTVTNFGVDYNKVTAMANNALNYASYNVSGLGLPINQTVYCTIKFKGKCNNSVLQIITNISGTDKLWTLEDPDCCASFEGTFQYNHWLGYYRT